MPKYTDDAEAIPQKSPFACGAACAVFITKALGLTQLDKVSTAMQSTSTLGMVECLGSTPWLIAKYVQKKVTGVQVFRFTETQPQASGGLTYVKTMFGTMKADLVKHVPNTENQYQDGDVILRMFTPGKWAVTSHFVVETRFVEQSPLTANKPRNRIQVMDPMLVDVKNAGFSTHTDYDDYLTANPQSAKVRSGLDLLFRP